MSTLRELRNRAGLTQQKLAAECGVARQTISNIELGINKPSVTLAKKIAKVLGCEWHIFFG